MDATPVEHIGARIKYWRRRRGGMSQEALAGLAGLSRPYISMLESGRRSVERRSTLVAIAAALQVSVADLLGQPGDPTDPRKAGADAYVSAIEVALIEIQEGERRRPARSRDMLATIFNRILSLRRDGDHAAAYPLLPDLLIDSAAHDDALLAQASFEASTCLRHLGYRVLALSAARLAVSSALGADDAASVGAARYAAMQAMPVEAAAIARRMAGRVLNEMQTRAADVQVRQVLGQLHLTTALTCAVEKRTDDAAAHLRSAEQEAKTLGDPADGAGFNVLAFGPTNVGLWRMAVAAELGEHGRVIELAGRVNPGPLKVASRHQSYWLDYGRALAQSGKTDPRARAAFMRAEQAAPVPFSVNSLARDAVMTMVSRARRDAVPNDLRVLATRLGISVDSGRPRP